jgi:hypothetical protein
MAQSDQRSPDEVDPSLLPPAAERDAQVADLESRLAEKEWAYRELQQQLDELGAWQRSWQNRHLVARFDRAWGRVKKVVRLGKKLVTGLVKKTVKLPLRAAGQLGLLARRPSEADEAAGDLRVGLRHPIPEDLSCGKGMTVQISGWAFHPARRIRRLHVRVLTAGARVESGQATDPICSADDLLADPDTCSRLALASRPGKVLVRNLPVPEVVARHFPHADPRGVSLDSGFLAEVTFPAVAGPTRAQVIVQADLDNGAVETATLTRLTLLPEPASILPLPLPPSVVGWPEDEDVTDADQPTTPVPLVVVCMATYNPPPELFEKQVESLRAQTWTRWVCIIRDDCSHPEGWETIQRVIGDDPRFVVRRNEVNLGFYKNFEALLRDVPHTADLVALADQDDVWYPEKLAELAGRFEPGVSLVFSDMCLVDRHGVILSHTYWTTRVPNFYNYAELLLANTVTGAASMFRRSLLEYLLPFPEPLAETYHDHWIGLVAAAVGEIRYVPQALYDYVQHSGQVIGHCPPPPARNWRQLARATVGGLLRWLNPLALRANVRDLRSSVLWPVRAGALEHTILLRVAHTARNVLTRCGAVAPPHVLAALREGVSWRDDWAGCLRLFTRTRRPDAHRVTCGVERQLLRARLWAAVHRLVGTTLSRLTAAGFLRRRAAWAVQKIGPTHKHVGLTHALPTKTAPLTLAVHPRSPHRVNVVTSVIDFRHLFGGYLTVFNLARRLAERDWRVRLILVDECAFRPTEWAVRFKAYRGLERLLDQVELVYAYDRSTVIPASPNDVFLATSWWTSHVAHQATRAIGRDRFAYLIQEFEPGFYPLSPEAVFALESYEFPHYALFSTELLREYFRDQRVGVFAGPDGERDSISFENAITTIGEVSPARLERRRQRRVLFYCRPERHAARNLFEVGLMALKKAIKEGALRGWEFHGVGSAEVFGRIELGEGVYLNLLPRMTQEEYRKILPDYDVGISLMWTPHPSLVPMEMAAAGLCTVTSVYANKTAAKLEAISPNLSAVEGTVKGVCEGLKLAEQRARDFEARARGAAVRWATTWDEAFPEPVLSRLEQFFDAAMTDTLPPPVDLEIAPATERAAG